MEEKSTMIDEAFDVGAWLGRRQAFALIAGRCSAAAGDILREVREKKLFLTLEKTWEDFCVKRIGMTRSYVDRIIRQYKDLGPDFTRLNCFAPIKPAEYRLIAGAITEDGLAYGGEVIALEPENATKLAAAVEALRRDSTPEAEPVDPVEHAFGKAGKAVKSAIAEFQRLQGMNLDDERRLKLVIALENCRNQVELIRMSTRL
jgi:hypothetical protein